MLFTDPTGGTHSCFHGGERTHFCEPAEEVLFLESTVAQVALQDSHRDRDHHGYRCHRPGVVTEWFH
jgi:hypothetical protein